MNNGKIVIETAAGEAGSIQIEVGKSGVNSYELEFKREQLKKALQLDETTPFIVFIQLPSKINNPGFEVDDQNLIT